MVGYVRTDEKAADFRLVWHGKGGHFVQSGLAAPLKLDRAVVEATGEGAGRSVRAVSLGVADGSVCRHVDFLAAGYHHLCIAVVRIEPYGWTAF